MACAQSSETQCLFHNNLVFELLQHPIGLLMVNKICWEALDAPIGVIVGLPDLTFLKDTPVTLVEGSVL